MTAKINILAFIKSTTFCMGEYRFNGKMTAVNLSLKLGINSISLRIMIIC